MVKLIMLVLLVVVGACAPTTKVAKDAGHRLVQCAPPLAQFVACEVAHDKVCAVAAAERLLACFVEPTPTTPVDAGSS